MGHTGGSTANLNFSEFKVLFETALGYESGGWGTCSAEKNQRKNLSCQCPFKGSALFVLTNDIPPSCHGEPENNGTVQRDFSTPIFFTKRLVLVSIDMPNSDFKFCQLFVELFVLKKSKY